MHLVSIATLLALLPLLRPSFAIQPSIILILVVVSLVNFFAFIFLYQSFHRGVVSVVAPIAYSYPAITTVFAILILGTILTETRAIALVAIMSGVILVSTRFTELRGYLQGKGLLKLTPGVGSAIISATSFGMVYVGLGFVTPLVGFLVPVLFLRSLGGLFGFLFAPILKEHVRPNRHSISLVLIVMGVLESAGLLSFNLGISLGSEFLPVVAALSGMGGAFAAAYAIAFLRERLELNQLAGMLLSIAGVFALLYLAA